MTARDDDNGASLQPEDPIDELAFFRGCTVAACISGAVWLVGLAFAWPWIARLLVWMGV